MKPLFFLDTETTGLKAPRLLQLAYVSDQGNFFNRMYKPPVPIEIEAMEVNHVTEKMVADCPAFSFDAQGVRESLGQGIVVIHNAEFDLRVLEAENVYLHDTICTKKLAKKLWPDFKAHRLQYLRYKLGLEIPVNAHEAVADITVLKEVFAVILKAWEAQSPFKGDREKVINEMIEFCR